MATENADCDTEISGLLESLETLKDLYLVQQSMIPSCAAMNKTPLLWILPLACKSSLCFLPEAELACHDSGTTQPWLLMAYPTVDAHPHG